MVASWACEVTEILTQRSFFCVRIDLTIPTSNQIPKINIAVSFVYDTFEFFENSCSYCLLLYFNCEMKLGTNNIRLPDRWRHLGSGGLRVRKLSVVALRPFAILVSRMHLATIALLCKQTTDNFRIRNPPEPRWRHLSGNRILFVPHWVYFCFNKTYFLHCLWQVGCYFSKLIPKNNIFPSIFNIFFQCLMNP